MQAEAVQNRSDAATPREPLPPLLEVENLRVSFNGARVVDGLSFALSPGEILGIVGESGSGKSMTALSLMRLLPRNALITASRLRLNGEDLLGASDARLEELRGASMHLAQEVRRGEDVLVRAEVVVACVRNGRAIRLPDALRRALTPPELRSA